MNSPQRRAAVWYACYPSSSGKFDRRKDFRESWGSARTKYQTIKKYASRKSLRACRGRDLGAGADSRLFSFKVTEQNVRQHCIGFDAVNFTAFASMHEILVR